MSDLGGIDGINQWNVLAKNQKTTRKEILLDYVSNLNMSSIIGYGGRYKLVKGKSFNISILVFTYFHIFQNDCSKMRCDSCNFDINCIGFLYTNNSYSPLV